MIVKNKDGTKAMLILEDGFTASLHNGIWVDKAIYTAEDLENEFFEVRGMSAISLLEEAEIGLGMKPLGFYGDEGVGRKCKKCGRINTHRLDKDGNFTCDGEWEDL